MFQDYENYSFTAEESIMISDANKDYNEKLIDQVIKSSGVKDILEKHKKEKNVPLTKTFYSDGIELSGGEWQKVALARMLYRDADFYILDEPSSSLDPKSEKMLFDTIFKNALDKTIILISHRLSNVINADRIIVMDNGSIVEIGSHTELMDNGGKYAELYNIQAKAYL